MRSIGLLPFAAISLVLVGDCVLSEQALHAASRPRYGGTLRVELHTQKVSLDPREWKAGTGEFATDEKMRALVFDRLTSLDNYGRFQPELAAEWSHDAGLKRWQFTLRAGVKFSDGSPLTAGDVVAALQPLLPDSQQVLSSGSSVVIQSSAPMPDLLEELSSGRYFVYRVQPGGTLLGTGPFFAAESKEGTSVTAIGATLPADSNRTTSSQNTGNSAHLRFQANEESWSGRPFVDAIEVALGVPALRQLFDLQLGKADLVELSPDLVRRATQENLHVWPSAPVVLYGLRFDEAQQAASDAKLREAVSLSLDRQTMANVLLQKQAEPASALLPQWLSGYAFLFTVETNIERAKEIRAALPASVAAGSEPLRLRVDVPGDLAKLLGERVAVNARQASIVIQMANSSAQSNAGRSTALAPERQAGLHLFEWHCTSLSPRLELDSLVSGLNLSEAADTAASAADPEQLYARERKLLEDRHILPLVVLPEYAGIGPNVRDWMPARWGEWHLADVWLDVADSRAPKGGSPNPAAALTTQPQAASLGAKP